MMVLYISTEYIVALYIILLSLTYVCSSLYKMCERSAFRSLINYIYMLYFLMSEKMKKILLVVIGLFAITMFLNFWLNPNDWINMNTIPTITIISNTWKLLWKEIYTLETIVTWATTVLINWSEVYSHNDSGVYSSLIVLKNTITDIVIEAKNKYNTANKAVTIERDINKRDKEILRETGIWNNSKAWKICNRHTNRTKNDCESIVAGKIRLWMTYDMLIESMGKPNSANPSNYWNGTQRQRCWYNKNPSCFYDDNDDWIIDSYN